ncbi:silent information regulator protein Sir2 [Theileria orientalis strain Shintoku]|uniref:Regulatory protein SIR2 homolog 7 n=1 Tax=Theileria orientalis strain Shintoku TaxID=869250 RepID=J4CC98_THEOR|nr:silent information regulator protein Sir2 [Theileria orientalis strain Shintoku]BAM39017.1 silent information regulator protein Sir2 [Theileria orientalis strain Shintoku]|eukprot:XP_009689318.1 silent information regulator protein Sir2 [Theileria orientalis strain Shintoku]
MVSSALNYANRLKTNNNKGPLGQVELFDTSAQVSKKTSLLYDFMVESEMAIVHTGAGVSTGSGIPDFRGPSGIWTIMNTSKEEEEDEGECSDNTNEGQVAKRRRRPRKKLTDANCIPTRKMVVEERIVTRSKAKNRENDEESNTSSSQNTETISNQSTQDDNNTNTDANYNTDSDNINSADINSADINSANTDPNGTNYNNASGNHTTAKDGTISNTDNINTSVNGTSISEHSKGKRGCKKRNVDSSTNYASNNNISTTNNTNNNGTKGIDPNTHNSNANNMNGVNKGVDSKGESNAQEVPKRKRGRPRKSKRIEENIKDEAESQEPEEKYKNKLPDICKPDDTCKAEGMYKDDGIAMADDTCKDDIYKPDGIAKGYIAKNDEKVEEENENVKEEEVKRESDGSECGEVNKSEYVVYGNKKTKAVEFILALPSEAHLCILQLLKSEKIKFIITQNIDGLHSLSGVPFNKLAELHGNVFVQRCLHCARRFQRSYVAPTISFHATGDLCGLCSFPPLNLLTDVVLDWFDCYEEHFENISTRKAEEADFHLSLGTSLHIEPACHYASNDYHRKLDAPLVIVNYQSTKLDPESDLIIHDDVNKVCSSLLKKFDMQIPVFKRKSHLIVLKHQVMDNNCVMIIKMSSISTMRIVTEQRGTPEYADSMKNVMEDPPSGFKDGVEWECVNKVQGTYKFTFNKNFWLRLTLFYETQVIVEVPYERVPLFKAEIWEFDICATNGSKLKEEPNTFTRDKFKKKTTTKGEELGKPIVLSDDGLNNDYDGDDEQDVNGDEYSRGARRSSRLRNSYESKAQLTDKRGIYDTSKYRITNYNESGYNITSYKRSTNKKRSNKKSDNGKDINRDAQFESWERGKPSMIKGMDTANSLIVIHEMKIKFNSKLIDELPFRMVGYLDLINNRSEEYEEYKMRDSMIMLSYLWGSSKIQQVQKVHYPASMVESYLNVARQSEEEFKSDRSSENDEDKLVNNSESEEEDKNKGRKARGTLEKSKRKKRRYEDDSDYEMSSESSYSESSIDHYSEEEEGKDSKGGSLRSDEEEGECDQKTLDFINHYPIKAENAYDSKDILKTYYDNYIKTTSTAHDTTNGPSSSEQGTIKKKSKIWKEMLDASKINELIVKKSIRLRLITMRNNKLTADVDRLHLAKYYLSLGSSLPLKLFVSKHARLGYLVDKVPREVIREQEIYIPEKLLMIRRNDILGLRVNVFELMAYNVIKRSCDFAQVENYVIVRLFYQHLPLWIVKYLSDLFECR